MAMYLSQIMFNSWSLEATRAIADPDLMHKLIWKALPPDLKRAKAAGAQGGRLLYRLENHRSEVYALVLSDIQPDWASLGDSDIISSFRSKPFKADLPSGTLLRFRLRANPTRKTKDQQRHPIRVGLYQEELQLQWLGRKAESGGFVIKEARVSEKGDQQSKGRKLTHHAVTFDGILQVADSEAFLQTLYRGIGSAKAFGFGLLSVAPL